MDEARIVLAGKLGGDFSAGSNLPRGIEGNVNSTTTHDNVEVICHVAFDRNTDFN
jgi:hypothetical protein